MTLYGDMRPVDAVNVAWMCELAESTGAMARSPSGQRLARKNRSACARWTACVAVPTWRPSPVASTTASVRSGSP